MAELIVVIAVGVALVAIVVVALMLRKHSRSAPIGPSSVSITAIDGEDLDSLADRLVVAVQRSCNAGGVALCRWESESVRELAAVGDPVPLRNVWIQETTETARAVTVGRTLLLPLKACDEVVAVIVVDGPVDQEARLRLDELCRQAQPLVEAAERRASRATKRLIELTQSADLDQVFEALAEGVAVTNDRGELVRVNAAGRTILEAAAKVGENNPLREALREGMPTEGMEVAVGGDEHGCVVQVKISKLSRSGDSRAVVAILRDVTRARTLEHQLRTESTARARHVAELEAKHLELERATRHKSEFLANMSHELRTPLNGIIGFTEILLEGTYGHLNAKQAECTRDVLEGGRHLLGLINDILDLSKIEAGKVELTRDDVGLDALVNNALTMVRPQAARKQLQIEVDLSPGLTVHGDADRIRQILLNLLSNAVKFTPAAGSVRLHARISEKNVRISVSDTGVGIAEADQDKLFKNFSQVDSSITRRFGGTGLGLTISKRLVELHGGSIGCTSKLGEGSTFWFEIPRGQRAERPPFTLRSPLRRSSVPRRRGTSGARSALIVDSHGPSSRIVARSLCDAGIESTVCESLADARAALENGVPSAIVIDPALPDATEAEAIELAVSSAGSSVVVMSTRSESEVLLPHGVTFVQKPLDRALLVDHLTRAIARGKQRQRVAIVVDGEDGAAICGLLQSEGIRTEHVTTCAAARELLERVVPELVVLELDLPDGDGVELLRTIARRGDVVTAVLTNRQLEGSQGEEVTSLATISAQKGALSRSEFLRRIETALQPEAHPRARILAVDDNDQNLRLITALLSARGYDVIEARDATSAIDFARTERPDLVLMDVMLPGVDGLTATRTLAADPRTRAIPVIAISANAMPEDYAKARTAGCCAYVTKPIDVRMLLDSVNAALRVDMRRSA
jgi:signal transduction histidine kinase/DNA-binding response OmpR family regulator